MGLCLPGKLSWSELQNYLIQEKETFYEIISNIILESASRG